MGTIVLRLRIEHKRQRVRVTRRVFATIERYVLAPYGATRLPSGEHQLKLSYQTDQDLDDLMDDLLFEISGEAQMRDCRKQRRAWRAPIGDGNSRGVSLKHAHQIIYGWAPFSSALVALPRCRD
jgi:hypothetical protein